MNFVSDNLSGNVQGPGGTLVVPGGQPFPRPGEYDPNAPRPTGPIVGGPGVGGGSNVVSAGGPGQGGEKSI